MTRVLNVLGAPSSAGAYAPGQERTPSVFREHGLLEALRDAGRDVHDRGDVPATRWTPDPARADAMNVGPLADTARAVADEVAESVDSGGDVLVLGGDCTVELGTVAGALRSGRSVGLVYIDLDADLKVPSTGEGALDWMGVAHLVDAPGSVDELASLGPSRPMLAGTDVLLFAQDNITTSEAEIIAGLAIEVVTLAEVHESPKAAAERAIVWASGHDDLLVHVDIDVLRWVDFPIAENSRRRDGLTLAELQGVLERLVALPRWRALTLCEINPDHAPNEAASFTRLIQVLADVVRVPGSLGSPQS